MSDDTAKTPAIKVVLVEDAEADVVSLRRQLRRYAPDAEVELFESAESLLSALADREPSQWWPRLFILDVNLPGMSGIELLARLKASSWARVPAVVLSGSASNAEVQMGYDHGAAGYLTKPIGIEQMEETFSILAAYWLRLAAPTNHGGVDHSPHTDDR